MPFYQGSKKFEVEIEVPDAMDMKQLGTERLAKSHVPAFGFQAGASLKPAPGNCKFQKLAGHYFKAGFSYSSRAPSCDAVASKLAQWCVLGG